MMKIVVLDGYAANPGDISWDEIAKIGDFTVYDRTSPEEIVTRAQGAEILLTNKCSITREIITKLSNLKYIGVLATGYNIIDTQAARECGVAVTNIPAYSTMSVAQHVFALILEIANRVGMHAETVKNGEWSACPDFCYWDAPLTELNGKTIGIIGFGSIGKQVAKIAEAFGMNVLAHSPSIAGKEMLERIYAQSDIISLNCPQKADNAKMINAQTIEKMKKGVWIINTARGGLIDEEAAADALKSGKIGCFAADVLSKEPADKENPLLNAPNTIITPHIAWAPRETRERLFSIACQNIKAFLNGEILNRVENK